MNFQTNNKDKKNMKNLVFAFALSCTLSGLAGERVLIWPEGKMPHPQGHQVGVMLNETWEKDYKPDEHRAPYIEWCDAPTSNKTDTCAILISGGGYDSCCDIPLVDYWRRKFTALGTQCVILAYRTPRPVGLPFYLSAWEDGQRAVRLVRADAANRGFDPEKICTISMSAGSHLATLLATTSQTPAYEPVDDLDRTVPCHINRAITCAIGYAVTDGLGIPNTRAGSGPDVKLDDIFKFDAKTCPMCMFHGGSDIYSPTASTLVYRRLREMKIGAELHLFADREHGFMGWDEKIQGTSAATGYDNWFERAAEFLRQSGFYGPLPPEVDLYERYSNDVARVGYEKQLLWPEGKMPDASTNQCTPYLEWHFPKELKTKAIQIIYSGGGYYGNSPDSHEVTPARRYLNEKGMTVVTMKYRTPRPQGLAKHTTAWQDLQRCIKIVRSQAESRGLDPNRIGIMGSSAGGHLTLMGATSSRHGAYWPIDEIDKTPCKVQWAVAIYPAYSLTDGLENENAFGGNRDDAYLAPEFTFDPDTCPMLFIHGDSDGWAAMNSVKAWEKLRLMGIGCDLHTLYGRYHCFQFKAAPGTGSYTWLDRIWEFMNHKGYNK